MKITKFKIISLLIILSLVGGIYYYQSDYREYRKEMDPVFEIKRNDKRSHPIFEGEAEPDIPTLDEVNSTVLGPDKNNNGIRDDIDIWINRSANDYNELMAMRQSARAIQEFLKAAYEKRDSEVEKLFIFTHTTNTCLKVIFKDQMEKWTLYWRIRFLTHYPRELRHTMVVPFYGNVRSSDSGPLGPDILDNCKFKVRNEEKVLKEFEEYIKKLWKNI